MVGTGVKCPHMNMILNIIYIGLRRKIAKFVTC